MKSVFAAVLLFASISSAQSYRDDHDLQFLSWCDGNKVVGYNSKGDVELYSDCSEKGQQCRVFQIKRPASFAYIATCMDAKTDGNK